MIRIQDRGPNAKDSWQSKTIQCERQYERQLAAPSKVAQTQWREENGAILPKHPKRTRGKSLMLRKVRVRERSPADSGRLGRKVTQLTVGARKLSRRWAKTRQARRKSQCEHGKKGSSRRGCDALSSVQASSGQRAARKSRVAGEMLRRCLPANPFRQATYYLHTSGRTKVGCHNRTDCEVQGAE